MHHLDFVQVTQQSTHQAQPGIGKQGRPGTRVAGEAQSGLVQDRRDRCCPTQPEIVVLRDSLAMLYSLAQEEGEGQVTCVFVIIGATYYKSDRVYKSISYMNV